MLVRPSHWVIFVAAGGALTVPARGAEEPRKTVVQRVIHSTVFVQSPSGSGSGWVYDARNKVLVTNLHVVAKATKLSNPLLGQERQLLVYDRVTVVFPAYGADGKAIMERQYYFDNRERLRRNGRIVEAVVLAFNEKRDLAVLQVESLPKDVPALRLAASSQDPGETHFAIGNPGAVGNSFWVFTGGRTKARNILRLNVYHNGKLFMHLAAQILVTEGQTNPGDSGGPVANDQGELVAVTQGSSPDGKAINYAIDVAEVREYLRFVTQSQKLDAVSTANDFLWRGNYYLSRGRPTLALKDFEQAEKRLGRQNGYDRGACLLGMAQAYRELGQFDRAITCCEKVLAEKDYWTGQAYAERAATRLAKLPFYAFGKPTPSFLDELSLGKAKAMQEAVKLHEQTWNPRKQEVLDDVRRALGENRSGKVLALRTRARYYRQAGDLLTGDPLAGYLDKELADRSAVLQDGLRKIDALERAEAYGRAGQYDKAIADCKSVLGLAPILARQRISEFQLRKGNVVEADKVALEVAVNLEPENPFNWEQLARIHQMDKDYKGVIGFLSKAIEANEKYLKKAPVRWHYSEIGDAYAAQKKYTEARAFYQAALKIADFAADFPLVIGKFRTQGLHSRATIEAKLRQLPQGDR